MFLCLFTDRPTPTLTQRTKNSDVFITEAVEFSCQVSSPDWTLNWYRDDSPLNVQGSSLKIPSVTEANKGLYACKAHLESRSITSEFSNQIELKVYRKFHVFLFFLFCTALHHRYKYPDILKLLWYAISLNNRATGGSVENNMIMCH